MSDPVNNFPESHPDPSEEAKHESSQSEAESPSGNLNVADDAETNTVSPITSQELEEFDQLDEHLQVSGTQDVSFTPKYGRRERPTLTSKAPLAMVETAFLASAASLIWLINYYFPLGPILRMFFPIPIALVYLRWGHRASWMAAIVSGLLLTVLMGPTRSIVYFIPYGLMGVQLGLMWRRHANWLFSIFAGTLIGTLGFFFRFWLFSLLLGEDLWAYVMTQITQLTEWGFIKLGLLIQPDLTLIQAIAVLAIFINNAVYLFVVHLVALLLLDRLGNPIPRPPNWVLVLLDYEG
jgi:uncharacterized protein YybS (DUF2232 family)